MYKKIVLLVLSVSMFVISACKVNTGNGCNAIACTQEPKHTTVEIFGVKIGE